MRIALLLATAAVVAYISNLTLHVGSDATPHVLTAGSWVAQGDANLDEYLGKAPFGVQHLGGHTYSIYPPGTAAVAFLPVWAALAVGIPIQSQEFLAVFGKLFAVLLVGLSVAFVYLACLAIARPVPALVAAVVYAFATSVWSVSSQQIWEHAPSHLFVALGTYLLTRRDSWGPRAGIAYGIATVVRPQEAIVAAFGALVSLRRGTIVRYVAWGLPAAAFLLAYNLIVFGTLRQSYPDADLPWAFPPPGWLGLLVAPSRGLFVYSPVLIFAVVGFVLAWRSRPDPAAVFVRDASLAVLGTYALYASVGYWWGGWTYGNRYMSDVHALFALAIAFAVDRGVLGSMLSRVAFAATFAWSFLLEFAGAGWFYELWNGYHWDVTPNIDVETYRVWLWTDTQWGFVLRRMVQDPGFTIVPALIGATIAAFIVWRAYLRARGSQTAEHKEIIHAQLEPLVPL